MNYSAAIESGLTTMLAQFGRTIVSQLSTHFQFDLEEAMRIAGIDQISLEKKTKTTTEKAPKEKAPKEAKAPKEKKEKAPKAERLVPNFALPFCGVVMDQWCKGVRANHELYTQCTAEPVADDKFCKACRKAADGNDGAHPFGEITERASKDLMEYEIRGKKVVPYGNVLAKLGKTREEAIAEAARFGWEIAEEQFETRKGARGRPRATSDKSDDEADAKKRGRPRKAVEVVNGSDKGDDMIAKLVRNARAAEAADSDEASAEPEETSPMDAQLQAKKQEAEKEKEAPAKKVSKAKPKEDKEAEKAAKAAAKEAEKAAAKAAKEAEKEAKAAAAKAAKEAEKAAAKAAKEAAKAATKPATKAAPKKKEDAPAPVAVPETPLAAAPASEQEDDDDEQIEVRPIKINGKSYLLATNGKFKGKLYDRATNKGIGLWNEEEKKIEELPEDMVSDDDDEEEDDE
jgi:hypothetical protein